LDVATSELDSIYSGDWNIIRFETFRPFKILPNVIEY